MDGQIAYVVAFVCALVSLNETWSLNVNAQETEPSVEPVVVTAPVLWPTNSSSVEPETLGLTGDFRKIDAIMPNVSINDAGADSFEDVYAVRGLNNTPNFSKQALTVYID